MAACLSLTGCVGIVEYYAPPAQRKPLTAEAFKPLKTSIAMNDTEAGRHLDRGIGSELHGGVWRWTDKVAVLRLGALEGTGPATLRLQLTTPELTMKDTGPVTIRFVLNGAEVASRNFDKPGEHAIELPVKTVATKVENELLMEIDKLWRSPVDGKEYGFILVSAGLTRTGSSQ
jgi:hypothetical protein